MPWGKLIGVAQGRAGAVPVAGSVDAQGAGCTPLLRRLLFSTSAAPRDLKKGFLYTKELQPYNQRFGFKTN